MPLVGSTGLIIDPLYERTLMKYELREEFDLVRIAAKLYRFDKSFGTLAKYGWTYNIYRDTITKKFVVLDFIRPGKILILDELPDYGVLITLEDIVIQHHADDNPLKRPVTIKII